MKIERFEDVEVRQLIRELTQNMKSAKKPTVITRYLKLIIKKSGTRVSATMNLTT